jgi:hypothetical protein
LAACDVERRWLITCQIAEWCRPEIVYAGGKPTAIQIAKHARALRSIGRSSGRLAQSPTLLQVHGCSLFCPASP